MCGTIESTRKPTQSTGLTGCCYSTSRSTVGDSQTSALFNEFVKRWDAMEDDSLINVYTQVLWLYLMFSTMARAIEWQCDKRTDVFKVVSLDEFLRTTIDRKIWEAGRQVAADPDTSIEVRLQNTVSDDLKRNLEGVDERMIPLVLDDKVKLFVEEAKGELEGQANKHTCTEEDLMALASAAFFYWPNEQVY